MFLIVFVVVSGGALQSTSLPPHIPVVPTDKFWCLWEGCFSNISFRLFFGLFRCSMIWNMLQYWSISFNTSVSIRSKSRYSISSLDRQSATALSSPAMYLISFGANSSTINIYLIILCKAFLAYSRFRWSL